jgi:hypothetical protein
VSEPRLFEAIARESEQRIGSFKPQELANTAWAFAVDGVARQDALVKAVNARAADIGSAALVMSTWTARETVARNAVMSYDYVSIADHHAATYFLLLVRRSLGRSCSHRVNYTELLSIVSYYIYVWGRWLAV